MCIVKYIYTYTIHCFDFQDLWIPTCFAMLPEHGNGVNVVQLCSVPGAMGVFRLAFLVRFLSKPATRAALKQIWRERERERWTNSRRATEHKVYSESLQEATLSWSGQTCQQNEALSGFITASAILIMLSQVKPAIGLPILGAKEDWLHRKFRYKIVM